MSEQMGERVGDKWHASTLGHFIGLLVDAGDPAVVFRSVGEMGEDEDGQYMEQITFVLVPNGHVVDAIRIQGADVHKTLSALIEGGKVR